MTTIKIKDWFGNKLANELRANLPNNEIFAVLKETEKAYYAMISLAPGRSKCVWVPKSATFTEETDESYKETIFEEDYDEALRQFRDMWSMFI